jgi:hypothetical protein
MSRCSLLIDECLPHSVNRGLLRRLPDVSLLRVGEEDAPAIGATDAELLAFCEQHQRILVTADRSTMPVQVQRYAAAGGQTWGVLVARPHCSLHELIDHLELVIDASESEEWINRYEYVPF